MIYLSAHRCWIGKKHLDTAMHHLSDDFEFNVHWKPFMLNPYMPEEGMPILDYLRLKFGDEAAEKFVSGSSPVSQQGKASVRYLRT
jgi:predicted DsbA family dithiol-disulfide isomerase